MPVDQELEVKEVIPRAYNVLSLRLEIDEGKDYQAGQFLSLSLKTHPALKRYLSISSSPTETGYIECTKKITGSDFSLALNKLKAGDTVVAQYPMGKFTLSDPSEKLAFLSGGIGITPIRSIAKYVVDKNLGTDMILLYANRTLKDIVFKEDFIQMQKAYPKLEVVHVLSEAEAGFNCAFGPINAGLIKDKIPDYRKRKFYLCGPPPMVEAMRKILSQELALSADKIITENFQGY